MVGKVIEPGIGRVLDAQVIRRLAANWGNQTIDVYRFGQNGKMLVLPHLSTFSLFYRDTSEAAFQAALAEEAKQDTPAGPSPGRSRRLAEHNPKDVIRLLVGKNLKRLGSASRRRFDCYRDGMTVAEFEAEVFERSGAAEAASCGPDLKWDCDHRFIQIERR